MFISKNRNEIKIGDFIYTGQNMGYYDNENIVLSNTSINFGFNNNGNDANQGFWIDLTRDIDITNQKEIILSFYAFDPNTHTILLKLENGTNADVEVSQSVTSGNANTWQNFTFDFSNAKLSGTNNNINATGTYRKLVVFIDIGVPTAGIYLLENITDG